MAIAEAVERRTLFPEHKPSSIEVPEEYTRDIAIRYLQSRRWVGLGDPDKDEAVGHFTGLTEAREQFLRMIGQKHLIELPTSSRVPLIVKPLRITLDQVNILAASYMNARKYNVEMDTETLDKVNAKGVRKHAQMIELASILFNIGQGDRVRQIDEQVGRSPSDISREQLVRDWRQLH